MRATRIVLLASLVVIASASASCSRDTVRGSGNVVARDVAVPSFSRLQVASGFEVTVSLGGQPSLTLHVDDNLDRHVDVGVDGDTLHRWRGSRARGRRGSSSRTGRRAMTSMSSCRAPAGSTGPPSSGP